MPTLPTRHAFLALLATAALLSGCGEDERPDDELSPARAEQPADILPAAEVIAGAAIAPLDPHTINDAEIRKALGGEPRCVFRYTSDGHPVVALGRADDPALARAVIKLDGDLVVLAATEADGQVILADDPVRLAITITEPAEEGGPGQSEAAAEFEIGQALRVGYLGYYGCR